MLFLVSENLLDEISRRGVMSRCSRLCGRIELLTSMPLQFHIVIEDFMDCGSDVERLDPEVRCAAEIDQAIKERADRARFIRDPPAHRVGETLQALSLDHREMCLMLNAASPEPTQQPIQNGEYRTISHWLRI